MKKYTATRILFSLCLGLFLFAFAKAQSQQKRALTHDDYDLWKSVRSVQLSDNGDILAYALRTTTGRGDSKVVVRNKAGQVREFATADNPSVTKDGRYVIMYEKVPYEAGRQEKKNEVKKKDRAKQKVLIYDTQSRTVDTIHRVKKYSMARDEHSYVLITKFADLKPKKDEVDEEVKDTTVVDTVKAPEPKYNKEEYALSYRLADKAIDTILHIAETAQAYAAPRFLYTQQEDEDKGDDGIYVFDVNTRSRKLLDSSAWSYKNLSLARDGQQAAYMAAQDSTETDSLKFQLWYAPANMRPRIVVDSTGRNIKQGYELNDKQEVYFSHSGKRMMFQTKPRVRFAQDTTMLDDERPQVDVWNYKDLRVQPEQDVRNDRLSKMGYTSMFLPSENKIVQLHDGSVEELITDPHNDARYFVGVDNNLYSVARSWESPWRNDYYIIDTKRGNKKLALEGISGGPSLAPDDKHALYYNQNDKDWYVLDLNNGKKVNATNAQDVAFWDEEDDHPMLPYPYGSGGFLDESTALVYSMFDVYAVDLKKGTSRRLTMDGKEKQRRYRTTRLNSNDRRYATMIDGKLLLTGFDKVTKQESMWLLDTKTGALSSLMDSVDMSLRISAISQGAFGEGDDAYAKANQPTIVYSKSSFTTYPDIYLQHNVTAASKLDGTKVSDANPQQSDFKWGTVELVDWTAYDGTPLQGLLYKPEDFDPNKKYPMIAYFYEKYTDNLHSYRSPQPSASTVNFSYLTSNDYLVFVPDIVYTDGKPGESAYNCIISGTEALARLDYVDETKLGIQGQSWGGYQTAYLVTRTNMFAAGMAGAPVSNMTSAYGGIRWGSGLSRAFQYERTQSRLGKNLWEGLDLYMENSPLFGIPKIETPLLMMHNDEDGAVPYYQGIEMFMGMRRLGKPAWLLVYNGEAHNLRKMKNKQDLSIRMMQFFDHYLKGEPAPVWMTKGRERRYKEQTLGYELDRD